MKGHRFKWVWMVLSCQTDSIVKMFYNLVFSLLDDLLFVSFSLFLFANGVFFRFHIWLLTMKDFKANLFSCFPTLTERLLLCRSHVSNNVRNSFFLLFKINTFFVYCLENKKKLIPQMAAAINDVRAIARVIVFAVWNVLKMSEWNQFGSQNLYTPRMNCKSVCRCWSGARETTTSKAL